MASSHRYRSQSVGINVARALMQPAHTSRAAGQTRDSQVTVAPARSHLLQLSPPRGHTLHPLVLGRRSSLRSEGRLFNWRGPDCAELAPYQM